MEWVVTTGRTVEEAKDAALDELGVDEVDAEFEVLEEPRQGLFGRQRGEARVRARVRPTAPRPKADRRDRRRRGRGGDTADDSNTRSVSELAAVATAKDQAEPKADDTGAAGGAAADASQRAGRRRRRGGGGGSKGGSGGTRDDNGSDDEVPQDVDANGGTSVAEEQLSMGEQGEAGRQFIDGLLHAFGVSADTQVELIDSDTVEIRVDGPELGLLIGPKGQTLQAIQELTRTAVQRRSVARTGRILVDVAGYRVRRREALERFTRQVAADVLTSGVQRVLEPMSAPDRKIVHDTANDIPGIRTASEGEEPQRRVVIIPGDAADGADAAAGADAAEAGGAAAEAGGAAEAGPEPGTSAEVS